MTSGRAASARRLPDLSHQFRRARPASSPEGVSPQQSSGPAAALRLTRTRAGAGAGAGAGAWSSHICKGQNRVVSDTSLLAMRSRGSSWVVGQLHVGARAQQAATVHPVETLRKTRVAATYSRCGEIATRLHTARTLACKNEE
jgi:hypothetical protein